MYTSALPRLVKSRHSANHGCLDPQFLEPATSSQSATGAFASQKIQNFAPSQVEWNGGISVFKLRENGSAVARLKRVREKKRREDQAVADAWSEMGLPSSESARQKKDSLARELDRRNLKNAQCMLRRHRMELAMGTKTGKKICTKCYVCKEPVFSHGCYSSVHMMFRHMHESVCFDIYEHSLDAKGKKTFWRVWRSVNNEVGQIQAGHHIESDSETDRKWGRNCNVIVDVGSSRRDRVQAAIKINQFNCYYRQLQVLFLSSYSICL